MRTNYQMDTSRSRSRSMYKRIFLGILYLVLDFIRRNFIVFLTFLLTYLVIFPFAWKDHVFSPYFRADKNDPRFIEMVHAKNEHRLLKARSTISHISPDRHFLDVVSHDKIGDNLTIGIITTARSTDINEKNKGYSPSYVTQVMASFSQQLYRGVKFGHGTNIFICNVDANGAYFKDVKELANIFTLVSKYTPDSNKKTNPTSFKREFKDYSFCLNVAQKMANASKYILLVQDDALPRDNFFEVLHDILTNHIPHYKVSKGERVVLPQLGYIKLFYPPKWSGYSLKGIQHMKELVKFGFLGGLIFCVAVFVKHRLCSHPRSPANVQFIFCVGFIYGICLVMSIGRPYIIDFLSQWPYYYRLVPAPECCIPAVVYPTQTVKELIPFLANVTIGNKDHLDQVLDKFMDKHNFLSYLVEPSLVSHIGMISTLNNKAKKAAEFIHL